MLSPKEVGIEWKVADDDYMGMPDYIGLNAINSEGTTYDWFINGGYIDNSFWLRSPYSWTNEGFFYYICGDLDSSIANYEDFVYPAFVIGE